MSLKPSINWLFAFIPITVILEHAGVDHRVGGGKGLVLTRETGVRDSRAAHQSGDA
jgi:hypothetical protein